MRVETAVVDTNVPISARLLADSVSARVLQRLQAFGAQLAFSEATLRELDTRLRKEKFRKYLSEPEIDEFLRALADVAQLHSPPDLASVCRDPDDEKFLALAVAAQADCIVSGDRDLLVLSPYEGIPICSPAEFLAAADEVDS